MKQVNYLSSLLILLVAISFFSCSDDDDKTQAGITNQSWTEGKPLEITAGNSLTVSFNASAGWKASSSSSWCSLLTESGEKGQNTLKVLVTTDTTTDRTSTITIKVDGFSSASFEVTQKASDTPATEDMEVNAKVDQYLREMYLWNDEYKTLNLDFNQNYEKFFYNALGSMKTNTLDKRISANGKYTLFSYIEKKNPITRSAQIEKELTYSFGTTGITPVSIGTTSNYTIYFCIQGIYPDSPAERAGIKRGAMISLINGEEISESNVEDYFYDLLYPESAFSLRLTESVMEGGA